MERPDKKCGVSSLISSSKPPMSPQSLRHIGSSSDGDSNIFIQKSADTAYQSLDQSDDLLREEMRLERAILNEILARKLKKKMQKEGLDVENKEENAKIHLELLMKEIHKVKQINHEMEMENEILCKIVEDMVEESSKRSEDAIEMLAEIKLLKDELNNIKAHDEVMSKDIQTVVENVAMESVIKTLVMNHRNWST